jgi:hypothetical protein
MLQQVTLAWSDWCSVWGTMEIAKHPHHLPIPVHRLLFSEDYEESRDTDSGESSVALTVRLVLVVVPRR